MNSKINFSINTGEIIIFCKVQGVSKHVAFLPDRAYLSRCLTIQASLLCENSLNGHGI